MSWLQSIITRFKNALAAAPQHAVAMPCYQSIVAAARQVRFYDNPAGGMAVPDTPQGRFEMMIIHAWLVIDRLAAEQPEFTQELFDLMFADFDTNLRELGVGDLGVGHRVKGWAAAFYGRAAAYKSALRDEGMLADALGRNIFAGKKVESILLLAFYVRTAHEILARMAPEEVMAGRIKWPE